MKRLLVLAALLAGLFGVVPSASAGVDVNLYAKHYHHRPPVYRYHVPPRVYVAPRVVVPGPVYRRPIYVAPPVYRPRYFHYYGPGVDIRIW